ncbi:MAG TPA: FixH family protein [Polyangiaceae bacterium]|nr:FixH family protein [Polyangiaceae bacterium]
MAIGAGGLTGEVTCTADARVDTYVAGLTADGERGVLAFRIDSSEPAPPAKGGNTWEVSVLDADGNLASGDLGVALDMPDHGHGSQVEPEVTYDEESGRFTITPLYLFMAGVWRIELTLASDADKVVDRGTFYFCIEG